MDNLTRKAELIEDITNLAHDRRRIEGEFKRVQLEFMIWANNMDKLFIDLTKEIGENNRGG